MTAHDLLAPSRAFVTGRCGKWYAWHDFTPGATPTLYVTGECWLDLPGVRVALKRASEQGPNPRILVLDKVVIARPGPPAALPLAVRYDEPTWRRTRRSISSRTRCSLTSWC